jgi:hypothetical protein
MDRPMPLPLVENRLLRSVVRWAALIRFQMSQAEESVSEVPKPSID